MRLLLICVFLIGTIVSHAQVSLDSSEFPNIGTQYSLANVAFIDIPPNNPAGPDQTYTFTGGFIYDGQLVDYYDASTDPFSFNYPTSTMSRYIPGPDYDQHFYYASDASGYWLNGYVWVGNIIDTAQIDTFYFYNNPPNEDTLLTDQYTYGYSDSTYAFTELLFFFGPTPVTIENHLYKSIDADGWGTMETGYGSYDSILRVHVTEYKYDSVFVLGNFDNATLDTLDYYLFYMEGVKHPLVRYDPQPYCDINNCFYLSEILNIPPAPVTVLGCTDSTAVNYSPMANQDDGSCIVCSPISYTITPNTYICEGSNVSLSISGGSEYLWSTGDSTTSITVSPSATTTYSVLISDTTYCWESASVEITVHDDVIADYWSNSPTNTDTTVFVNLSYGATDYFWDFGDGNTSTDENPSHFYSSLGAYVVTLVASNLCSVDTLITTIQVQVGVEEYRNEISLLSIVPNPVSTGARVLFELDQTETVDLEIIDLIGRKYPILQNEQASQGLAEIDISSRIEMLPAGIYFIRLSTGKAQSQLKWIKL